MIHFTFSTVYMAIIASNLMLVILTVYFRKKELMVNAGYRLLSLVAYLTILRLLIPLEFPFTINLSMIPGISYFVSRIQHPFCEIGGCEVSIRSIAGTIWLIGFVLCSVMYLLSELRFSYAVRTFGRDITDNPKYSPVVAEICDKHGKTGKFQIILLDCIATPMMYGIFSPKILVPVELTRMNLSRTELTYVFSHEMSHHYHHDLITKRIISIFCLIYWWNPCCRILSKQADIALEMRVDEVVTNADPATVAAYTRCLIALYETAVASGKLKFRKSHSAMSVIESKGELIKRFEMMAAATEKSAKKKSWNIGLLVAIAILFISSYLFIFEAHYMSPEIAESTITIMDANGYAIHKMDGSYDVYYDGYFLENTDSLTYYSSDMPVYTEAEAPSPRGQGGADNGADTGVDTSTDTKQQSVN